MFQSTAKITLQFTVFPVYSYNHTTVHTVFKSIATITLRRAVCSSLPLQSHYSARCVPVYSYNHTIVHTVFKSTGTITLRWAVCSSLPLQSHYSAQCVPLYNHTVLTPCVSALSRHIVRHAAKLSTRQRTCVTCNVPDSSVLYTLRVQNQ